MDADLETDQVRRATDSHAVGGILIGPACHDRFDIGKPERGWVLQDDSLADLGDLPTQGHGEHCRRIAHATLPCLVSGRVWSWRPTSRVFTTRSHPACANKYTTMTSFFFSQSDAHSAEATSRAPVTQRCIGAQ